jgi:GT2 family glycosyltransferase
MTSIAILMTCHNHVALTARALDSLDGQPLFDPANLFLVDDGSSDGTGEMVRSRYRQANVIRGNGNLFWNGGMRVAWQEALRAERGFDYFLWLNDDVVLRPDALRSLVRDVERAGLAGKPVIMAGATVTPGTAVISYGGQRRVSALHPLRLKLIEPEAEPVPIETVSGNVVLVSAEAERIVGNLAPCYEHIYGDLDYGLRARRLGVPVLLASAVAGECSVNSVAGLSIDPSLGLLQRLRKRIAEERKVHLRDWRRFVRRHSGLGPFAVFYSVSSYFRLLINRSSS